VKTDKAVNVGLFIFAVVFFIGFDLVSTMAAASYLGSFDYEGNGLFRLAYGAGGMPAVVVVKVVASLVAFAGAYVLAARIPGFKIMGRGILAGAGVGGAFVGLSNLNILFNNRSFWVFGIDSGTFTTIIMLMIFIGSIGLSIISSMRAPSPNAS
jgi:hypothetical protein